MKFLISGASGLIGSALVASLASRGDEVVTLVRPSTATARSASVTWNPAEGTIDQEGLQRTGPFDAVIHLAGAGIADKRWTSARKAEIATSRTASTDLLARSIARLDRPPSAFVCGSAIGFYGDRGDEVLTEDASGGAGFLADVCHSWESAASPAIDAGIRTSFARTGIVLSAKGGALAKQLPLFKLGLGGKLSTGSQWMSWISIGDEIAALRFLATDERAAGPVNLTAPGALRNADFTRRLGRSLHRPAVFVIPAPALRLALGSQLVDEALLASARVEPRRLLDLGFHFSQPSLEEALHAFL